MGKVILKGQKLCPLLFPCTNRTSLPTGLVDIADSFCPVLNARTFYLPHLPSGDNPLLGGICWEFVRVADKLTDTNETHRPIGMFSLRQTPLGMPELRI